MSGVTISALIKKMNLELLTKEINTDKIKLYHPDVNRPAPVSYTHLTLCDKQPLCLCREAVSLPI